jgi:hypothetical protein
MQKSKPQSKQAPICTTTGKKHFSLFQQHSNLFETTLLDENQHRTVVEMHLDARI